MLLTVLAYCVLLFVECYHLLFPSSLGFLPLHVCSTIFRGAVLDFVFVHVNTLFQIAIRTLNGRILMSVVYLGQVVQ